MKYALQTSTRFSRASLAVAAALVIALALLPVFASRSLIQDVFFILTMLTLAQFWNLLAGYGNLLSIGQQAFVGVGAYAMFALVVLYGWDPLAAVALAGCAALLVALPFGFFSFRLQGAYFAIGTWVLAEVLRLLFAQFKTLGGGTGASLPRAAVRNLWGGDWVKAAFDVKSAAARDILTYYLALALAAAAVAGIYYLLRSRQGLALSAVRDNAEVAGAVGVNARLMKWRIFLFSAFGTGLAGALIYLQKARISPDAAFSVTDWTAYIIFIVVIGGIGSIEGPILGVLVFFLLQSLLADYGSWYLLSLGVIGIIVMLFAPRGLWGLITDRTGLQCFPIRRLIVKHPNTGASDV